MDRRLRYFESLLFRYLGVCRPFFARRVLTVRRARTCIVVITMIASAYNACRFWEYSVTNGRPFPLLREHAAYVSIYVHWMYFAFVFLLPFFVIVVFNCLVVIGVRQAMVNRPRCQLNMQQRHERRTTLMLLVVVAVFLFCNSLSWPLNAYETFAQEGAADEAVFDFVSDLNNLLVLAHPALNILVYMYFSRTFRNKCFPILCHGTSSSWRASMASVNSSTVDVGRRRAFSMAGDCYTQLRLIRTSPTANSSLTPSAITSRRQLRYPSHSSTVSLQYWDANASHRSSFSVSLKPRDFEMHDL